MEGHVSKSKVVCLRSVCLIITSLGTLIRQIQEDCPGFGVGGTASTLENWGYLQDQPDHAPRTMHCNQQTTKPPLAFAPRTVLVAHFLTVPLATLTSTHHAQNSHHLVPRHTSQARRLPTRLPPSLLVSRLLIFICSQTLTHSGNGTSHTLGWYPIQK